MRKTMNREVNREDLIQYLITLKMQQHYCSKRGTFVEDIGPSSFVFIINSAIEALRKETQWIPVSEELPEEDGEYLCTIQIHNGTRVVRMTSFAKDLYAIDNFDFYDKKGKAGWFNYDDGGYYEVSDVIAWDEKFKLPQPYEESEDKE